MADAKSYYADTYAADGNAYAITADASHAEQGTIDALRAFVADYHLHDAAILDVGAGRGLFQDLVSNYTGLELSPTAMRYFHKPLLIGSATDIVMPDASFDAVWSVWTLEHIPDTEKALSEIRRVVKPGGLIYLAPAWDVPPWAPEGLDVRPSASLTISQKIRKALIPLRRSFYWWAALTLPVRALRCLTVGPTRLRTQSLTPNYETYWQPDSDATTRLDLFEVARWFTSRGDLCLTRKPWLQRYGALLIQRAPSHAAH